MRNRSETSELKSCIQKNATEDKLLELISRNLDALENITDYNIENKIKLFRISSDFIPFGASPVNKNLWWKTIEDKFILIGEKIRSGDIRVSMHPGQHIVLSSNNYEVAKRAIF